MEMSRSRPRAGTGTKAELGLQTELEPSTSWSSNRQEPARPNRRHRQLERDPKQTGAQTTELEPRRHRPGEAGLSPARSGAGGSVGLGAGSPASSWGLRSSRRGWGPPSIRPSVPAQGETWDSQTVPTEPPSCCRPCKPGCLPGTGGSARRFGQRLPGAVHPRREGRERRGREPSDVPFLPGRAGESQGLAEPGGVQPHTAAAAVAQSNNQQPPGLGPAPHQCRRGLGRTPTAPAPAPPNVRRRPAGPPRPPPAPTNSHGPQGQPAQWAQAAALPC